MSIYGSIAVLMTQEALRDLIAVGRVSVYWVNSYRAAEELIKALRIDTDM